MVQNFNTLSLSDLFTAIELDDRNPLDALLKVAKFEDQRTGGDITAAALVPEAQQAAARLVARAPGKLCGLALAPRLISLFDESIQFTDFKADGDLLAPGDVLAEFTGPLRSILGLERVLLNFITHLSGIATLTARYVDTVADTSAKIYDTRKTIPGLRTLAKYAVRCGGGFCHRIGLYDAVLVKDNHIAHIPLDELAGQLTAAFKKARNASPPPSFIEVEVDTLDQLRVVLSLDADIVLLDNMPPDVLREAVTMRNDMNPQAQLEASGGINLQTVRAAAESGVDRIAVGALTHSAPALDVGLDIT
ncbi:carboxylating nicotinate-nucleotide diphosphorylase [Planctomycetales bacterium ZRK34]|nr:carboxylating nicotinate-nucleotide diphosphorylase [Planctomycetales bacterium ZRK34]